MGNIKKLTQKRLFLPVFSKCTTWILYDFHKKWRTLRTSD